MVCLGNICRSPTAEAVFRDQVAKRGLEDKWFVDSAGTSDWFAGELPERRARKIMQLHGLRDDHVARPLTDHDFHAHDFILGMDYQNVNDIKNMRPESSHAIIGMLGHYDPHDDSEIQDPYFRNDDRLYQLCYERCLRAVSAFLDQHKDI